MGAPAAPDPTARAGVYRSRRPRAALLFRLLDEQFRTFTTVYDEAHDFLLAFSCKCRCLCPSCHAKRLAGWSAWLETRCSPRCPTGLTLA